MRPLPEQPNLDQLRRQARELQRAAARREPDALHRLQAVSPRLTLGTAQLALAREYGFPNWARLKAEVERRRQHRAPERRKHGYVLRPVASLQELTEVFDLITAQITPPVTHTDRRFRDLARRFPEDRMLMLVAEDSGRIVGGALAFKSANDGGSGVTLRVIGLEPSARGQGLGRRLMQTLELQASRLGAPAINLRGSQWRHQGLLRPPGVRRSGHHAVQGAAPAGPLPASTAREAAGDCWRSDRERPGQDRRPRASGG